MTSKSRHSRSLTRPASGAVESAPTRAREGRADAPRARGRRSHNLPLAPSSLVGREDDLERVTALLSQSRLVTLTGPGGMGKTRLAVEVAVGLVGHYPDGVWMVELAGLADPALLPEAVASAVPGPQHHPSPRTAENAAAHIGEQAMLLVLDNCEHLVDGCGRLADLLLKSCPGLTILATTREPLGIDGEHRWTVRPLSLPISTNAEITAADVSTSAAGELFVRRATAALPRFELADASAPVVAQICGRLDGMPLAIELAAIRMASLSATDVLERLDDRFGLLTTGSRAVLPRHQTLSATLEWSYALLTPAESKLLRQVSVFAGWMLDAAQEVCQVPKTAGSVVDILAGLVTKSLVQVETTPAGVRYSLLETLRDWVGAKLSVQQSAELRARHATWCLALAEREGDDFVGPHQEWLDRIDSERLNMTAALEWCRDNGKNETGARLATALTPFWRTRGHLSEGYDWLEWAAGARRGCSVLTRAKVLRATGLLRGELGDTLSSLPLLEESSALFAQAGDHDASLCTCNSMFHMYRNPQKSLPGLRKEIERCRNVGDNNKLAHFLWGLGQANYLLGQLSEARRCFEESVERGREERDGEAFRSGLFGVGRVALLQGEADVAEAVFSEARAQAEEMDDADDIATAVGLLGDLARARGDWDVAHELLDESLRQNRQRPTPVGQARAVYFSARLAQTEAAGKGHDNGAGELFADALRLARGADNLGFHDTRCLLGLGWAAAVAGETGTATGRFLEALATAQSTSDAQASAQALDRLSRLARDDGRLDEADTLARRALDIHSQMGDLAGIADSLDCMAGLAADSQRQSVAVRLLAASQSILDGAGLVRFVSDQALYDAAMVSLRDAVDPDEFDAAWAEGSALSIDQAVTYASRGRAGRDRPATGWDSLTPAEQQVVNLVGEGLTNPEVGRRLFISPRTVGHHLAHVYQKLGIHSRGALIKALANREPTSEPRAER